MCPRQPGCSVMACECCRLWCKRELGFYECTTHNFGRGVIGKTLPMAILKVILLLYWTAMWMYRLIDIYILVPAERREKNPAYIRHREYSDYLTNWGDTLIFLYLLYSTLLVFHGTWRIKCVDWVASHSIQFCMWSGNTVHYPVETSQNGFIISHKFCSKFQFHLPSWSPFYFSFSSAINGTAPM